MSTPIGDDGFLHALPGSDHADPHGTDRMITDG
jgi:hypothetical protein